MSRKELATHFEELARWIRKGRFSSENKEWSVPDRIDNKIRFKEKKGRFEAKLKFRWSTLKDYDPGARKAVDDWQDSIKLIKRRILFRTYDFRTFNPRGYSIIPFCRSSFLKRSIRRRLTPKSE
jgi:amphi-Trp domain-containing protein